MKWMTGTRKLTWNPAGGCDYKGSIKKGKLAKEVKVERAPEVAKGLRRKVTGKSNVKGKDDPLKKRIASRTQCPLCVEKGH